MIGIVGNMKVRYRILGNQYEQIVNPQTTSEFCLMNCKQVKFRIEEVTYIEDTVYGVVLSLLEPQFKEDEFIVGSGNVDFYVEEYGVTGDFSLCF